MHRQLTARLVPVLGHGTLVAMRRLLRGFTLVELLVTITVISILATIVYANVGKANPKARDVERQADLRNLQTAIEQYKQKNGEYPAMGCAPGADQISGENDCTAYIAGLAPEFISVLPKDTQRGSEVGYAYVTNATVPDNVGTSYKVMAVGTVESETVTNAHPMKRCDTSGVGICTTAGVCSTSDATYQKTYALWGGFADGATEALVKSNTAAVICL